MRRLIEFYTGLLQKGLVLGSWTWGFGGLGFASLEFGIQGFGAALGSLQLSQNLRSLSRGMDHLT